MEKICAECGGTFESRRGDTRTCSKRCWRAVYKREQPSKKRQAKARASGKEVVRRRRSEAELLETQRKAVQLSFSGLDVAAIQRMLGYSTWAGAQAAIRAGMGEYRGFLEGTSGADMRAYEVARVDWEIRQLMPVLLKPTPKISTTGRIVLDQDGNPVPDHDLRVKAIMAYDKIADRGARLKGVYPEKDANVTVVPVQHTVVGVDVGVLR